MALKIFKTIGRSLNPTELVKAFHPQDFYKAMVMIIAMVVPIAISVGLGALQVGVFISLGVFYASPSDTSGSVRLKAIGMLLATLLSVVVTYVLFLIEVPVFGLIPIIGVLMFGIAYLSIYGFRASLISFSGLFAIVLSFSSLSHSELSIYIRLLLIATGGLWYVGLVLLRHFIFPKGATEYYVAEALKLTANYIVVRTKLIDAKNDRKALIKELLSLQSDLTTNHETLRELLLNRRRGSGTSYYQARRFLVFRQLVDILELAMANPVNYRKTDDIFAKHPEQLVFFQSVMKEMSIHLNMMAKNLSRPKKIKRSKEFIKTLQKMESSVFSLKGDPEDLITLRNYFKYEKNQWDKIQKIERLLRNQNRLDIRQIAQEDRSGFLTKQQYNLKVLVENFNLKSTIFRHSLRIALVAMVGYGLGIFLNIENAYWVLLTVVVIMRPNFGLTKTRFKHRSIGTLLGGIIAFLLVFFIRSHTAYAILGIMSFVTGFSMVQRNYRAAATFITMYVIFVYALLRPTVFDVIQFRVLDTFIGAALSFAGNMWLWPTWEIKSIDNTLKTAINANSAYLQEIATYYETKGTPSFAYKLSRKKAFLALSDLSSSFQRMTQEPKTQHKNKNEVFQLVMLSHSFLASLASLGTYIIHNPTTPASKDFLQVISKIKENLSFSKTMLAGNESTTEELLAATEKTHSSLSKIAKMEGFQEIKHVESTQEEAQLISEQLQWLLANSERMTTLIKKVKFE